MHEIMTTAGPRFAARATMATADLANALERFVQHRQSLLADGERGAQAAEYAMLGGVSAAACSALVALLKNKSTLETVVDSVVSTLGNVIEGWF